MSNQLTTPMYNKNPKFMEKQKQVEKPLCSCTHTHTHTHTHTPLRRWLLATFIVIMMLPMIGKSQNTCLTAVTHTPNKDWQWIAITPTTTEYWLTFVGDTTSWYYATVEVSDTSNPKPKLQSATLYNGSCTTLNQLAYQDSITLNYDGITQGQTYYLKLVFTSLPTQFQLRSIYTQPKDEGYSCTPTSCDGNIVSNGDFLTMNNNVNSSNEPFPVKSMICAWDQYNGSPQANTGMGYLDNGYAYMWGHSENGNNNGEAIRQNIYLPAGSYDVAIAAKLMGFNSNPCNRVIMDITNLGFTDLSNLGLIYPSVNAFSTPTINSTNWTLYTGSYTNNQSGMRQVIVMPYQNISQVTWVGIDNIHITPKPTVNFTASTCSRRNVSFYYTATTCHQTIQSVTWDFGDGNTLTTTQNPVTHTYSGTGPYTVTVTLNYLYFNQNPVLQVSTSQQIDLTSSLTEISGNKSTCDASTSYSLVNGVAGQNYQWSITPANAGTINSGNGTQNINVTWNSTNMAINIPALVSVYNPACDETIEYKVWKCCVKDDHTIINDETITSNLTNGTFYLNGEIKIDANVSFTNATIYMGQEAKIIVNPTHTLTINTTNIKDGCNYMWDGIFVTNPQSSVICQNNSSIRDAFNAIVSDNGAIVNVTSTSFLRNLNSIIIKNSTGTNPLTVKNCYFFSADDNAGVYPANLHQPYSSIRGSVGIQIKDVTSAQIGNPITTDINKFGLLDYGIEIIRSNVNIYNNSFTNIQQVAAATGLAIVYNPTGSNGGGNTVNVGDGLTNYKNTFTNCRFGVVATGGFVNSKSNTFTNCTYAFTSENPMSNSVANQNTLTNCSYGISMSDVTPPGNNKNITITGNTIANPVYFGIQVQNISSSTTAEKVVVAANEITYNTINPSGSIVRRSIWINAAPGITVSCNKVNNLTADNTNAVTNSQIRHDDRTKTLGIAIYNTANATIKQNTMSKMGTGIWGEGNLGTTQFTFNVNTKSYWGIYFNPSVVNTIVDQGISTFGSGNTWTDFVNSYNYPDAEKNYRITGTVQFSGQKKRWYYWNVANQIPNITGTNPAINSMQQILVAGNPISIPACPTTGGGGGTESSASSNTLEMNEVASPNTSLLYVSQLATTSAAETVISEEESTYTQLAAYKLVNEQPSLVQNANPAINEYYSTLMQTNAPTFGNVGQLYKAQNIDAAITANDAISAVNTIERNTQYVNKVVLNYLAKGVQIPEEDLDQLHQIALQQPYFGGEAVYRAKTILNRSNSAVSTMSNLNMPKLNNEEETQNLSVYPNPASDRLYVNLPYNENISVTKVAVYNVFGQLIHTFNNLEESTYMELNTADLNNGIYFVVAYTSDGKQHNAKFIKE